MFGGLTLNDRQSDTWREVKKWIWKRMDVYHLCDGEKGARSPVFFRRIAQRRRERRRVKMWRTIKWMGNEWLVVCLSYRKMPNLPKTKRRINLMLKSTSLKICTSAINHPKFYQPVDQKAWAWVRWTTSNTHIPNYHDAEKWDEMTRKWHWNIRYAWTNEW